MTDRIRTLIVQLDEPIRDDDLDPIIDLIRCVRHVADVHPVVAEYQPAELGRRFDAQHAAIMWHRQQIERLVDEATS